MIRTGINIGKLSKVPFFDALSEEQLKQVANEAQEFGFEKGETIKTREETNTTFWILLYGSWSIKRFLNGTEEPAFYETDKLGSWHGGISIIDVIAPAEIKATSYSYVMQVNPKLMEKWIQDGMPIQEHLLKGIGFGGKLLYDHYSSKK
ncbi:hypothetical protein [uncultured Aquimarina sp.]|uniref:hypothetical protein n=1 Tax=uncultured Aquimarina sp. TaxID=575652 RepID=UPI00261A15EC|nr:hypothetical protein [uncultured Aquimarina sp.]